MQPSREAIEWGKRQAAKSPRWSDTKWKTIGIIFGVEMVAAEHQEPGAAQDTGTMRDAA